MVTKLPAVPGDDVKAGDLGSLGDIDESGPPTDVAPAPTLSAPDNVYEDEVDARSDRYDGDTPLDRQAQSLIGQGRGQARVLRESLEDQALDETVRKFIDGNPGGFFKVRRIGPPGMPQCEYGFVAKLRAQQIRDRSIEERIEDMPGAGGGEYEVTAWRSDNTPAEVPSISVQISGDPKPKSAIGRAWLRDAKQDGREDRPVDAPRAQPDNGFAGGGGLELMLRYLDKQENERKAQLEIEREERKRVAEEQKQEFALRQRELELRIQNDREAAERERADQAARNKARIDNELEMMRQRHQAELETIRANNAVNLERAKAQIEMDKRASELRMTNGLGFDSMQSIRKQMAEMFMEKEARDNGMGDDDEDDSPSIMGILKDNAPTILNVLQGLLLGGNAAPAEQAQQQAQPAGPALPAPQAQRALPHEQAPDYDVPDAAPAGPAAAPQPAAPAPQAQAQPAPQSQPEAAKQLSSARDASAQQLARVNVIKFARGLAVVMRTGATPEAAWGMPLDEQERTLADLFDFMPAGGKAQLQAGWPAFENVLKAIAPDDLAVLSEAVATDAGKAWMTGFLSAGPWTEEG